MRKLALALFLFCGPLFAFSFEAAFTKHAEKQVSENVRAATEKYLQGMVAYVAVYEPEKGDHYFYWKGEVRLPKEKRVVFLLLYNDDPLIKKKPADNYFVTAEVKNGVTTITVALLVDELFFDNKKGTAEERFARTTSTLARAIFGEVQYALENESLPADKATELRLKGYEGAVEHFGRMTTNAGWKRIERPTYREAILAEQEKLITELAKLKKK